MQKGGIPIRSIVRAAIAALLIIFLAWPVCANAAENSSLALKGFFMPCEVSKGQAVDLAGKITSKSVLTSVSLTIYNVDGLKESSLTATPVDSTFELNEMDEPSLFASLTVGSKTLTLTASYGEGEKTLVSQPFNLSDSLYCFPVPSYKKISTRYGEYRGKANRKIPYHYAIDISAKKGAPIYACASGKVVDLYNKCKHKGPCGCGHDCGNHIEILSDSGDVYKIRYSHMTTVLVTLGQMVQKGQKIGTVGNTGRSTGPHLDLKFTAADDEPINPESYYLSYLPVQ